MLKSKKAVELSFAMLFSIIAGAIIIFLAIYAATNFASQEKAGAYSQTALDLSNLLSPIANNIITGQSQIIRFTKESRIYINCSAQSSKSMYFGSQSLAFSEESGLIKKWSPPGSEIIRNNKYIFGHSIEQGKKLQVFSLPFNVGYRVDDLVILAMDSYCFISPPDSIKEKLAGLLTDTMNISATGRITDCPKNSVRVCFGEGFTTGSCNITVEGNCEENYCRSQYDIGRIALENGKNLYYSGNLIYAAIFSSPEIYECNIARLGKKTAELGRVYREKIEIVKRVDCNSQLGPYLDRVITISENLTMNKLANLNYQETLMDDENCKSTCELYASSGDSCFG